MPVGTSGVPPLTSRPPDRTTILSSTAAEVAVSKPIEPPLAISMVTASFFATATR